MRFGKKGQMNTMCKAWGILMDLHPLGLQRISDAEYQSAIKTEILPTDINPVFEDGDPRKGELFAIIEGVEKHETHERRVAAEDKK